MPLDNSKEWQIDADYMDLMVETLGTRNSLAILLIEVLDLQEYFNYHQYMTNTSITPNKYNISAVLKLFYFNHNEIFFV